jgi:hypothetical protein
VIAGGYVDAIDQATFGGSGAPQSFLVVISTKKGCLGAVAVAGCGANGSAIRLSDNVSGAIFYAADSLVDVSNNADAHTVVGYMVKLDDNVKINYDPAEASIVVASDAGGTVGAWTLTRWSAY